MVRQLQPPHNTTPPKISSRFGSSQVYFRSSSKPIPPFVGLIRVVDFFGKVLLPGPIQDFIPFRLSSPDAVPPAHTLMAFFFSLIAGATRFARSECLHADKALHAMPGIQRFPNTNTVRKLRSHFTHGVVDSLWATFGAGSCPTKITAL